VTVTLSAVFIRIRCLALALSIASCAVDSEDIDPSADDGLGEAEATGAQDVLVAADRTAGSWQVVGFPSTTDLAADVDDGTAFAQADGDTSYVRSATGVGSASHKIAFASLPAGAVSQVAVSFRARAAHGGAGSARVELYDDQTLVASGAAHTLSGSYASFTDTFAGLAISDGDQIRARIAFTNTAGAGDLRYTEMFARVTLAAPSSLKAPCRGLMTRSGLPASGMPFVDSAVIQVYWKDLESADQQFSWSPIDTQIASLKAHGVVGARLRILAGIRAPDWVKKKGHAAMSAPGIDCSQSGGIAIYNAHDDVGACSTFFWTDAVLDEYEELMQAVAARYDGDPFVREVVDSACMTVYAEPFYRAHADLGSNTRLWQAGLSLTADRACHERAIQLHDALFTRTRTSLAINTWDIIDGSTDHHTTSWPEAKSFVDWARGVMGGKLVLQNNGKGESATEQCLSGQTPSTSYWCYLDAVPGPKGFQTETWDRLGGASGLYQAIEGSLSMGANFLELPGGYSAADPSTLADYDQALEGTACCAN
jgi:hypothetical protein